MLYYQSKKNPFPPRLKVVKFQELGTLLTTRGDADPASPKATWQREGSEA